MRYSIVLVPEPEEGGFSVEVPLLPGCYTQGETVEQALERVKEAIAGHVASLLEAGEEVPEESIPVIVTSVEVDTTCAPATAG
jgi:antitoxin HicB